MSTYVLLTGAKANVGDHLIVERAKQLLKKHISNIRLIELHRWEPLDQHLNEVNDSQGLILCGGPAYQQSFYPDIYPLVSDLEKIKVPIIPFGLGWKGIPGDGQTIREYKFTASSIQLLKRVHRDCQFTSCRDHLTKRVLERYGFTNVIMTGDPAWYDLSYLENAFISPSEINTIALSAPAGTIFYNQYLDLAEQLRNKFPKARIICTFHHGWEASEYVSTHFAQNANSLKENCLHNGFEVISLAKDIQLMKRIYDGADIHVGYRLHAHLYSLSHRKPSFLMEEDGRGHGASESLGLLGVIAWSRTNGDMLLTHLPIYANSLGRKIVKRSMKARNGAVEELMTFIQAELNSGFARFRGLHKTMEQYYYSAMTPFLDTMPGRTRM